MPINGVLGHDNFTSGQWEYKRSHCEPVVNHPLPLLDLADVSRDLYFLILFWLSLSSKTQSNRETTSGEFRNTGWLSRIWIFLIDESMSHSIVWWDKIISAGRRACPKYKSTTNGYLGIPKPLKSVTSGSQISRKDARMWVQEEAFFRFRNRTWRTKHGVRGVPTKERSFWKKSVLQTTFILSRSQRPSTDARSTMCFGSNWQEWAILIPAFAPREIRRY